MKQQKKAMIEALKESLGIVTTAAKIVGINRENHYNWYRKDKKYKEKVDKIEELVFDFVKSKLYENIENGEMKGISLWLQYKGHKFGWISKKQVSVEGNLNNVITAKDFSDAWENIKKEEK